ncbi:uroporphyrinogen-III synthase [Citricoccus muralis]|uniref:Uroporphyrinogen-III synthase n=1 Tax=Citricoccus muralis TaxID=169134 RepID=A0A3D9LDJ4_9MICC|nr:uroporphyrinogen-III synthase [Citricoccus muralis]REE03527.1 uroporphyrinogen-III synthase [Citricoccus muralis]
MSVASGRPVILTRQPAQAGAVEAGLAEAGYRITFLPLTDFALPEDLAGLRGIVRQVARAGQGADPIPAWLVLTSPNTVRALVRAGWDGRVAAGLRVAVTGTGTARVLAEAGCTEIPWMPEGDASAAGILAQFPPPGDTPRRVLLLPQSALASDEVAEGLTERGWEVHHVQAYRTVPYPAATGQRLLDGPGGEGAASVAALATVDDLPGADVVLTSPSAVRELVRRRGTAVPAGTRFIALGQPTARAAAEESLDLAATAPSPDAFGVLAAVGLGHRG